jgi:integrase
VISIEQRYHRGDLDEPKTDGSRRKLALGDLDSRFRAWVVGHCPAPASWVFAQKHDPSKPLWDSGVRDALHQAASLVGCDFTGLGPHSFRRANITWRQAVGGSAIEVSKIAGHSEVDMTADCTLVGIERQQELTRAIQERLRIAAEKVEEKRKQRQVAVDPADDDFERFMRGLYGKDVAAG